MTKTKKKCVWYLGERENETYFDFDEEGFIDDALYQLKCVHKYDRVFRNGEED
jgi:hypothetical protein